MSLCKILDYDGLYLMVKTTTWACKLAMSTFWMWWCTSLADRLAPTRDGDDSSEIERLNSVSEVCIHFGHRL